MIGMKEKLAMGYMYGLKKGNCKFEAWKHTETYYSIDRNTKGFGGSIKGFYSLRDLEEYAKKNGFKRIAI